MESPPVAAPRRGRPASLPLDDKIAALEHQLAEAKAAKRESERRKFTVLGEAIAAEAAEHPGFRATLADILRRRVTSPQGKADIAAYLLAPLCSESGSFMAAASPLSHDRNPAAREARPEAVIPPPEEKDNSR